MEGKQVNGFNHLYQLFSSVFVILITAVTSSHPNWSVMNMRCGPKNGGRGRKDRIEKAKARTIRARVKISRAIESGPSSFFSSRPIGSSVSDIPS